VHTPSLPRGPRSRHPLERPPFPLSLVANCVLAAQLRHRRVATLVEWANRSCAAPCNLRPAAAPSYTGEQLCRRKRWCRILLRSIHIYIYIYYIVLCSTSIPHCRSPMSVPPMPVHGRDARVAGCRLASHSRTQLQWGDGALLVLIVAVLHVHSAVTRTAVPPCPFCLLPVHGRGAQVAGCRLDAYLPHSTAVGCWCYCYAVLLLLILLLLPLLLCYCV